MSWSFSVTEKNEDDAIREFKNTLEQNTHVIPELIRGRIVGAAAVLASNTKPGYRVTLSTNGHANDDGTWYGTVNVNGTFKNPEEVPNVPGAVVMDGGKPDTNEA